MSSSFIPREVRAGVPAWGEGGEMEGGRVGQRERGREAECLTQSESSWVEGTLVSRTSVLVHCHTAQF